MTTERKRKRKRCFDGKVTSKLNFGGLGPARVSGTRDTTTGQTVVTMLMTTCYDYEEGFAVFFNFNIS